jgi:prepilin-type processing-associated H-X9-DG protein
LPRGWQTVQDKPSFAYGWAARLLPQLEMSTTAAAIDFQRAPADLRTLSDADSYFVSLFVCPSDIFQPTFELLADDERHDPTYLASRRPDAERGLDLLVCLPTSSFLGVHGTTEADEDDYGDTLAHNIVVPADGSIVHDRDVRFDDLKRGLSKTMIVGERTMAVIPSTWLGVDLRGEDAACRLVGAAITSPNCESCDECEFSSRHPGGSHFLWADGHVAIVSDTIDTDVYQENAKRNR